jgi:photosystem II stability/assembly factor-like uncharacterized protein
MLIGSAQITQLFHFSLFSTEALTVTPALLLALALVPTQPAEPEPEKKDSAALPLGALKARLVGPAVTSGRVVGFAVHPTDRARYFVAVASGGVWKTTDAGTNFTPVFDGQGSYSIGCVVLDPKNPNVVWVGTGENNSQRSVAYGDGVYKSTDAGKTWQNVGLKLSEHVGKIVIDPRDSDTVYVAAQGPLWKEGGDRGLYKTTDGGKTWSKILNVDDNTGVTDLILDPRNPDVLLAASWQRRRHVWTIINGGPGSALHRSTDGGKSWKKVTAGLPGGDLGRIGLAQAPTDPDVVYAIVEAPEGGIFRSTDRGVTWEKRNPFTAQAQYYQHLVVDPTNKDRLYVMNVRILVSDDGGKTLNPLGEQWKHSDNHDIWIDPADPRYYLVGCDGGIYESFDRAAHWHHKSNLPVTQFYDVACDESGPFYHVYGGTQDNFTLGGPARTRSSHGIMNQDWFVVQGGDGFHCKVDPSDPNIVYGVLQYGVICRFDRKTGQRVQIQPMPGADEPPLRWNWDSPLIISPHNPKRLYFAANRLFKSDDRGDSWTAVSPDLTRQLDRNKLAVMGKVWGPDAIFKSGSTSLYGACVAMTESPLRDGLIYIGTDDGLIQVTEDGGKNWRKTELFPGIPDRTFVSKLVASRHDAGTVYACFDNHKNGDFAPYVLKSTDTGKTWTSVAGDLPARGTVYCLAEDHVDRNLLFCGTEFGLFVSPDGGQKWHRFKNGLPTIMVKDLCVQRQANDLVVGTFGRGIFVIDDYSPLRGVKKEDRAKAAVLFPVRDAVMFIETAQFGEPGKAYRGASFFTADNPAYGASFTYSLKEGLKTRRQKRKAAEEQAEKRGEPVPYPTPEELRAEAEEEPPSVFLVVTDADGGVVRTVSGPTESGAHRVAWDLRDPSLSLSGGDGPLVAPGKYTVALHQRAGGVASVLAGPVPFTVALDTLGDPNADDVKAQVAFHRQVLKLRKAVLGAGNVSTETATRLDQIRRALEAAPKADEASKTAVRELIARNREILRMLRGDTELRRRNENTPLSISERIGYAGEASDEALARPTTTARQQYDIAAKEFTAQLAKLRQLVETDLPALEKKLDAFGAPLTPGRLPVWEK